MKNKNLPKAFFLAFFLIETLSFISLESISASPQEKASHDSPKNKASSSPAENKKTTAKASSLKSSPHSLKPKIPTQPRKNQSTPGGVTSASSKPTISQGQAAGRRTADAEQTRANTKVDATLPQEYKNAQTAQKGEKEVQAANAKAQADERLFWATMRAKKAQKDLERAETLDTQMQTKARVEEAQAQADAKAGEKMKAQTEERQAKADINAGKELVAESKEWVEINQMPQRLTP